MVPKANGKGKTNQWTMELSIFDGVEKVGRYIKEVTYTLHPTYAVPVITVKKAPFTLQKIAWGYFDVQVKIKFQDKFNMKDVILVHNLCFGNGGLKKVQFFKVDDPSVAVPGKRKTNRLLESKQDFVDQLSKFIKSKG